MNRLTRFFFPAGLFALAMLIMLGTGLGLPALAAQADNILLGAGAAGLLLTLRYGVSRQFFTLVMLIGLGWGAPWLLPTELAAMTGLARWYFCLAAMLVPLHCLLFAWWADRGLFNTWGAARLIWLALVPTWVVIVGHFPAVSSHRLVTDYLCHDLGGRLFLPAGPAAAFALAGLGLLLLYRRDTAPNYEGFFWVLALLAAGFFARPEPVFFRLLTAAAMITLLLSLIEAGLFFAFRDELTGLPARRALNHQLQKLGGTYTLAMIDVDHFKRFNDRYGHDVGDEVLQMVAARLKKSSGKAYRYGGEEFTLVYPGRDMDAAAADAEAVRELVAESGFVIRNPHRKKGAAPPQKVKGGSRQVVSVTVSLGLAERTNGQVEAGEVLKAADKALYKAKKNGRNRVVIWGRSL